MTANVIPFPSTANPDAKTYWFAGGSLHRNVGGRGVPMTDSEARRRRYQHEQEAIRYHGLRDVHAARKAAALWRQLTDALDASADYCRAVGKPEPKEAAQ